MTKEDLTKILENHKHWINEDCEGWRNMRANLYGADLCSADLYGADLYGADLYGADLHGANLCDADLHGADLCSANLHGADLHGANLCSANLHGADLYGANLCSANLCDADLHGADLCSADLYGADLYGADLYGANLCSADLHGADLCSANLCSANLRSADLHGANLCSANLHGADLYGAKNMPYIPMVCPEEGEFIGWKKATNKIVKLEIPADAKRASATSRKCRCSKAKVIEIYELDGTVSELREIASSRDINFIYKVGQLVEVADFDDDRWNECSTGIHFFMNRQEAINYY